MAREQKQEGFILKSLKAKLNKNHLQGFISGVLITAILFTAGFFAFFPDRSDKGEDSLLTGNLQYNQYVVVSDLKKEVIDAPGQTLVYFNDSSLLNNRLTMMYDSIYERNSILTKTYNYTRNDYGYLSAIGINLSYLPCFAIFEDGKLKDTHPIQLMVTPVIEWLAPFTQPKIYRAFPSSAYDSVGDDYRGDYYVSEIILMPDRDSLRNFIKLSGDMTLPVQKNMTLYALLSDKFGGDNKTTFGLPNLDSQIPASGLRYFMATVGLFPQRDIDKALNSYVDGNIKYLEFPIDYINDNSYMGQVVLAKNVDEAKYKNVMIPCDGREFTFSQYPVLASLIGDKFGGDGVTKFRLPDLRNVRSPIDGAKYYIMLRNIYPTSDY